jgi:hypothetical protein
MSGRRSSARLKNKEAKAPKKAKTVINEKRPSSKIVTTINYEVNVDSFEDR